MGETNRMKRDSLAVQQMQHVVSVNEMSSNYTLFKELDILDAFGQPANFLIDDSDQ